MANARFIEQLGNQGDQVLVYAEAALARVIKETEALHETAQATEII
jgi:hypothetical protein